jgi:hypothetical protein
MKKLFLFSTILILFLSVSSLTFAVLGRTTVWEPASVYLKRELVFLGFTNYSCIEKCINDE